LLIEDLSLPNSSQTFCSVVFENKGLKRLSQNFKNYWILLRRPNGLKTIQICRFSIKWPTNNFSFIYIHAYWKKCSKICCWWS